MIYISSSCIRASTIHETIDILYKNGFKDIELSGGTSYYDEIENDIIKLKTRYNLNYLCHNYFPPPKEPFVLNLASLNDDIYQKTLSHLEIAIKLARKLNAVKFGFHAGFLLDFDVNELGGKVHYNKLFDPHRCICRFCEGFNRLKDFAGNLELYIENNVISYTNLKTFDGVNPFMMTDYKGYQELKKLIDFKLLLDIAHLEVSSNSLGLNFEDELYKMMNVSDYLHLSGNDGLSDQNRHLVDQSALYKGLKRYKLKGKIVTLEVRGTEEHIKNSYNLLSEVIG